MSSLILVLVCLFFTLIATPSCSVAVNGPLLDKVNSKPLISPIGSRCRWTRTSRRIGAIQNKVVRDRTACMEFSNNKCIFDRLTGVCITKSSAQGHNTDILLSSCVKRCSTISCKNRCKEQKYAEADDSNDKEPEYDTNGGVEKLRKCLSGCATRSCKERCYSVGYLSESTKNSRTYKVSLLKRCISKCATRSCKSRCQEQDFSSTKVVKDELETDLYLNLKKKAKRCYRICMEEFGKRRKCLKTCGAQN
eukprot:g7657.t1